LSQPKQIEGEEKMIDEKIRERWDAARVEITEEEAEKLQPWEREFDFIGWYKYSPEEAEYRRKRWEEEKPRSLEEIYGILEKPTEPHPEPDDMFPAEPVSEPVPGPDPFESDPGYQAYLEEQQRGSTIPASTGQARAQMIFDRARAEIYKHGGEIDKQNLRALAQKENQDLPGDPLHEEFVDYVFRAALKPDYRCPNLGYWRKKREDRARPKHTPRPKDELPELSWIWPGRIARPVITAIGGPKGVGKSTLCFYIAARVSMGLEWPDGTKSPVGRVLLFTSRENAPVIDPMIKRFGGSRERVTVRFPEPEITIKNHFDAFAGIVKKAGPDLILIDSIEKFAGLTKTDSFDGSLVCNRIFTPLEDLVSETGASIVFTRHTNKKGRPEGSKWFMYSPRAVHLLEFERPDASGEKERPRVFKLLPEAWNFEEHEPEPITWMSRYSGYEWRPYIPANGTKGGKKRERARALAHELIQEFKGLVPGETAKERAEKEGISWRWMMKAMNELRPLSVTRERDDNGRKKGALWRFGVTR